MNKKKFKSSLKSKERFKDVDSLLIRLKKETPSPGDYLFDYKLADLEKTLKEMENFEAKQRYKLFFSDLPISNNSIKSLSKRNFNKMTEVQRCVIPHALVGRDIMAASKTGSGKTLSYLIPLIERLYLEKWTVLDGLGALIILPTRELAVQVFQVFNSITEFHELSVGLIIGGKDLEFEKKNIHIMNVLICTPGRLLQHIEESPGFSSHNLKILVLDEADMILEMGFANTLNSIMNGLPEDRQTMLFSATLSKNIQELGRLSLKSPEFIFLHAINKDNKDKSEQKPSISDIYELPNKLEQFYMKMNLEDKLDNLFSFLKSHVKSKILIFFSTCKQVRFTFEAFKKLRIGIPLMELHGRQKQSKRMAIFFTFSEKRHVALMTTNIAARGLDFPYIDWIVQVDVPENAVTYIHRIGRTARYRSGGKSLLFIIPEQIKFLDRLKDKNIEIKKIEANPKRALTVKSTLQSFVSESIDLKYLAQRAFISYMRFVFLSTDKEVFNVHRINAAEFSESLGLIQIPVIKFKKSGVDEDENQSSIKKVNKLQKLKEKIKEKKEQKLFKNKEAEMKDETENFIIKKNSSMIKVKEKLLKKRNRENTDVLSKRFENLREMDEFDEDDELLVMKKKNNNEKFIEENVGLSVTRNQMKKIKNDGYFEGRNKIKFDEKGNKYTLEDLKLKEYKENLENITKDPKQDLMKEYKRKVIMNKEIDDANEIQRRKDKRKKRKLQRNLLELSKRQDDETAGILGEKISEDE